MCIPAASKNNIPGLHNRSFTPLAQIISVCVNSNGSSKVVQGVGQTTGARKIN